MQPRDMTDAEAGSLNLKKMVTYVRIADFNFWETIHKTTIAASEPRLEKIQLEAPSIVPTGSDSEGKNKGPSRQSKYLANLSSNGLSQLNVVVKNVPQIRTGILELAKRTRKHNDWEAVVKSEPVVLSLINSLESTNTRLMRIADLEARHKKAYQSILIHQDLLAAVGYRKLLLKLAGFSKVFRGEE